MTVARAVAGVVLLSAASASATQLSLAVPDVTVVGLPSKRGAFYSEFLADRLTEAGARVMSAKAIAELLGAERQRQLLGCSESSCIAELASALGSDGIAFGEVADVSGKFQINLKVISASAGKSIATFSERVPDEEALLDTLETAAEQLAKQASEALGRELVPTLAKKKQTGAPSVSSLRKAAIGLGAFGLACGIAGGVLIGLSGSAYSSIPKPGTGAMPLPYATAASYASTGSLEQTLGWVGVGVAAVALVAAVVLLVLGR